MRGRLRRARTLAAAAVFGLICMSVASPSSGAVPIPNAAAAPVTFQSLQGEGAWSIFEQLVPWENELATAPQSIDLNYTERGSLLGREDLIKSMTTAPSADTVPVDYAISGVGFTPDELAKLPGGSSDLIAAPVQVSTLAALVEPPNGGFTTQTIRCDPDDPTTWPPGMKDPATECIVNTPYAKSIRIPWRNLAAMFFHYQGFEFPNLLAWNNTATLAALGLTSTATVTRSIATFSPQAGPAAAERSDPDEVNYYLQHFVQIAAPDVWAGLKAQPPPKPWDPITERLPQQNGVSRDGAEQQVEQLAHNGFGVDGVSAPDVAGGVAAASPSMQIAVHSAYPAQQIDVAQIQNGNGDWVSPTPASINAAVDTGNDTPLYALTNRIPGAYPLVWVDHLYAPAHGLSIAKTESLAMLIRYLATTGQAGEAAIGEGRLSPTLVGQALAAANQLVTSNCVGADRQIVASSDPGPLTPPTATAMHSIGNMLHCEPVLPPPTTTTTTATSTTTSTTVPFTPNTSSGTGTDLGTTGLNTGSVSTSETGTTTPPATVVTVPRGTATATTTPAPATQTGLLTALKLPLAAPVGAGASDRVATFLLGAALYLLLRKPAARFVKRLAS